MMIRQISGDSYALLKWELIFYLPGQEKKHKLKKMKLGAFRISGNTSLVQAYQKKVADIIMQSWRTSTRKQYGSYFQRLVQFCSQQQINKIMQSLREILSFLTCLHDEGLGNNVINTAKSMLSAIFEIMHR